jgi:hypothetical protein
MNKRAPKAQNNRADEPEKKILALMKDLWLGSCARFTVLCVSLLLLSLMMGDSLTVAPSRFLLLFPFAVFLKGATATRRTHQLTVAMKCVLHPVLTLGGFYLCCYLPYQVSTKPSGAQILLVLLLVGILYAVVMGIYLAIAYALRGKKNENAEYVSQFGKKS